MKSQLNGAIKMQMERIKFCVLIGNISHWINKGFGLDESNIKEIDYLIDQGTKPVINHADLNNLLLAFKDYRKIDAIKHYRELTGFGLKEAKEAIDAVWSDMSCALEMKMSMISNISEGIALNNHILYGFSTEQLASVKRYIASFSV